MIAKRATAICDMGEKGVCYEMYELGGRPGWSFIFQSGRYDGFSPEDVEHFLDVTGEVCTAVVGYEFQNVTQMYNDFHLGRFAAAFK